MFHRTVRRSRLVWWIDTTILMTFRLFICLCPNICEFSDTNEVKRFNGFDRAVPKSQIKSWNIPAPVWSLARHICLLCRLILILFLWNQIRADKKWWDIQMSKNIIYQIMGIIILGHWKNWKQHFKLYVRSMFHRNLNDTYMFVFFLLSVDI